MSIPNLEDLYISLSGLTEPDRFVDHQIALVVGWTRSLASDRTSITDPMKKIWLHPVSKKPGRVPRFTSWTQSALNLLQQVSGGRTGAAVKRGGRVWVQVDTMPTVQAATLPLALCLAALQLLKAEAMEGR